MQMMGLAELVPYFDPLSVTASILRSLWREYEDAEIRFCDVSLADVTPVSRYMTHDRLERAKAIIRSYVQASASPYVPAVIKASDVFWLLFPPVVEVSAAGRFLLDGTHRSFAACSMLGKVTVVEVERSSFSPLACEPQNWSDYKFTSRKLTIAENLVTYDERYFRPLTTYFNTLAFANQSSVLEYVKQIMEGSVRPDEFNRV